MGPLTATVIIVVALSAVAITFLILSKRTVVGVGKEASDAVKTATEAAERVASHVTEGIGDVAKAIADRIRTRQDEMTKLRQQVTQLTQQNDELLARKIEVTGIQHVLQLALIEADFNYFDFDKHTIKEELATPIAQKKTTEYLGVFRTEYKQRLGVDLAKLRFQKVSASEVVVSGLGTEVIGIIDTKITHHLSEIRNHYTEGTVRGDWSEIVIVAPQLMTEERKQRDRIQNVVNQNTTSKMIHNAIKSQALAFLKVCLKPAGIEEVKPSCETLANGLTFAELCKNLNDEVEKRIKEKKMELESTQKAVLAIQDAILCETQKQTTEGVKTLVKKAKEIGKGGYHGQS